jgi:hydrogenase-4 component F
MNATDLALNPADLLLAAPALGALVLIFIRGWKAAARVNIWASALTLAASAVPFFARPETNSFQLIDDFNIYLVALTAFVAFTTSLFSAVYIAHEVEAGRLVSRYLRFYHSMYQAFVFTMMLALTANNLGVMWVAIEGATLTTVLMVSLYRTPAAIEAAWKYFILCGVGIALALFGTTLMYLAAQPVMGAGLAAMTWSALLPRMAEFNPAILNLAFVFLLIGYGTKVGLVPLHAWLPDAHAEGPTPISAVLSGLLLNVALYVVLRYKILLAANPLAVAAGPMMVTMGLSSVLLSGFMLYRRRDIKRLFAYSSIEHMGIVTFAFGMGGPLANFAGLLHMTMHSLTKSAIFYAVGHITQVKGTQQISQIRGLTSSAPLLGWALVVGVAAIAGLPPFGVFLSEFLVLTTTFDRQPILALLLLLGLLVGFGGLFMRLQGLVFGPGEGGEKTRPIALVPLFVHLLIVLIAGIYLPRPLVAWFQTVAHSLG